MKKKIKPENRVITQCSKCNKPYSYDKNKGWKFGNVCRECGERMIKMTDKELFDYINKDEIDMKNTVIIVEGLKEFEERNDKNEN